MAKVEPGGTQDIELLKDEGNAHGLMMEDGITTLSFYKGDFNAATKALRAQFGAVVAANPWLAGNLVKEAGASGHGIRLRHPESPQGVDVDRQFLDMPAFKPSPTTPYLETCTELFKTREAVVASGSALLGKGQPVSRLTVAPTPDGDGFSVAFSLCHAVGDGRTYYEILKMLKPGAEARPLNPARVFSFSEEMRDMCGRRELEWADECGTMCLYTCGMMFGGGKPKCYAFHLDEEKLAQAKAEGASKGGVSYVTTNDVLTSGFFTACKSRIGMMGMDCRDRVPGVAQDLAGNYVTALTMDSSTFGTPGAVRNMLANTPFKTTTLPLPTCFGWMCGGDSASFAMASNWASFAGDLLPIEGSEHNLHLPVKNPAYCVFDLMVPFASSPGKVGVLMWTVSSDEKGLRKNMPCLGERLSSDLFP